MSHFDEMPLDYTNLVPVYQQTYSQEQYNNHIQVFSNNNENLYAQNVSVDVGENLIDNSVNEDRTNKVFIHLALGIGSILFFSVVFYVGWLIFRKN
jgi:hypothetical protein